MTAALGLDLGTSQVKALVRAADGTVLGQASARYPVSTPRDGWAETDPALWWLAVRTAVRALGPARAEVRAIALAGQMHGLVLCAERSMALRPAIVWLDRRAIAETADYLALPAPLRAALGNQPSPGMAGPLLLWLSRHEPDAYRRARWQLQPKDWLRLRLTGEAATDPSDASATLLYDLAGDRWAWEVAEALGLRTDLLPPVLGSADAAGTLLPGPAGVLGLRPGIPVATGAADTAASLLASGSASALLTLGSGGQWVAPAVLGPVGRTNLFRCAGPGVYRLAPAQNTGITLDWVRRTLGASWDELYATAARDRVEPEIVFRPYLTAERWDEVGAGSGAGGGWTGLTLAHQREDLMRAALTGVARLLRERLDDLRAAGCDCDPARALIAGGGSRHPAWRHLLTRELGIPLRPASAEWLTATGAASLAALVVGAAGK